jgi:hypothetical protein
MPTDRRLAHDDRGAILLVGLFGAVFLTGILYALFGIGETIRHHERMNDAVDAGAYGTAVMHARAMNLVALANMVTLSVTALQTAYLAIITGAAAAIAWIKRSRWRRKRYGWVVPFLVIVLIEATSAYFSFSSDANSLLRASSSLQQTLRDDLPTIALLKAETLVVEEYDPPARALSRAPDLARTLEPMPIREGSTWDTCRRAFPFSARTIREASRDVPSSRVRSRFRRYALGSWWGHCLGYGARIWEMSDSRLGGESFQIRLAAHARTLPALGERGVMVATHGYEQGGISALIRDQVSKLSLAQAEYYFDGPQDPNEMLWRMEWQARMRRYRDPGGTRGLLGPWFEEVYR